MVLAMVLAMPAWAQKEKNHDFVVAKNMDVFTSIYKNLDMMYVDTLDADAVAIRYGQEPVLRPRSYRELF